MKLFKRILNRLRPPAKPELEDLGDLAPTGYMERLATDMQTWEKIPETTMDIEPATPEPTKQMWAANPIAVAALAIGGYLPEAQTKEIVDAMFNKTTTALNQAVEARGKTSDPAQDLQRLYRALGFPEGESIDADEAVREIIRLKYNALDFVHALKVSQSVMDTYRVEQNRWWRKIDGTPIPNDLAVRMATAYVTLSQKWRARPTK